MITIRTAEPAEYTAVGTLTVSAYEADDLLDPEKTYAPVLANAAHRAESATVLVAVEADRLVGAVTYCLPGSPYAEVSRDGEAEFRMLAVDPAQRGRGIGEVLAQECLDRARADGCPAMVISTDRRNAVAHRLYQRLGFQRVPERDWSPVAGVNLLVYRLDLAGRRGVS